MAGKGAAPRSGAELKQQVVTLAQNLGLKAQTEIKAARRLWGQRRYIDVVITDEKKW
jgi:predicted metal-binding protein